MAKTQKSKRKPSATSSTRTSSGKQKSFPVASRKHSAKHKSKKASSLFGPISTQQPRSMKWNLTESMGGSSKKALVNRKNNRRNKETTCTSTGMKKRPTARGDRQEQPAKTKPWTLNMPIVSSSDQVVPWLTGDAKIRASDRRDKCHSNKVRKIHQGLALPVASLTNLNAELQCFADYVRLNESEISSRRSVVELIQTYCRHLFGVSPESCKVFGSFACLPVCNFISDVDMAIHDVVHSQNHLEKPNQLQARAEANDGDDDDPAAHKPSPKRVKVEQLHPNPNLKRQERILAWKKALDDAEKSRNDQECRLLDPPAKPAGEVLSPNDHEHASALWQAPVHVIANHSVGSPSPIVAPVGTDFEQFQKHQPMTVTDDDGLPLFVIDKEGCLDSDEQPQNSKPSDTDAPTVTDTSKEPSTMSDDDAQNEEERCFIQNSSSRQAVDESSTIHSKHNGRGCYNAKSDDESETQLHEDESDVDSADILAPLRKGTYLTSSCEVTQTATISAQRGLQRTESGDDDCSDEEEEEPILNDKMRSRSQSVISLCSATTCSDTEEKEWDDSGMEVSFVSHASPAGKLAPTAAPTLDDETRAKVIRALNSLSRRLRGNSLTKNVHVRKKAKVPIINMETRFGYECDIAIGGHNGTDTSSFALSQCKKFRSFADVVLLLKILLNQHGLDKPFTGGIGSFKLYVLVASHIEKHLELGGEDDAAEILISFLFRYGSVPETDKRSSDSTLRSPLTEKTIVTVKGTGPVMVIADMGSVFQLENCIRLFQACYFILRRKLQKPSNDPSHSLLGYIIDAGLLRQQRLDCYRMIPHAMAQPRESSLNIATFPTGLPLPLTSKVNTRPRLVQSPQQKNVIKPGGLSMERQLRAQNNRKISPVNCGLTGSLDSRSDGIVVLDTDDEAEQLKAGYGIFAGETSSRRHDSNPKTVAKKRRRKEKR